ncbi:MAG: HNH endonuclease [Acidobacteriota bacterium]|nr:HNH endonuclease [Acidobacteriota bacterium]
MADPYIPVKLRRLVERRAGNRCEYCGAPADYSSDTFTFDHILPRSLDGLTTADNPAMACFSCNQHKATRIAAPIQPPKSAYRSFIHASKTGMSISPVTPRLP